jgi:hypothetical protein
MVGNGFMRAEQWATVLRVKLKQPFEEEKSCYGDFWAESNESNTSGKQFLRSFL